MQTTVHGKSFHLWKENFAVESMLIAEPYMILISNPGEDFHSEKDTFPEFR